MQVSRHGLGRCAAALAAVLALASVASAQDAGSIARGKEQFVRNCAPCHGADRGDFGRAMLPGTDALRIKYQGKVPALLEQRTDLTPELLRTYVRKGTWSMPPFRKTELSDAQIDEISAYIASAARMNTVGGIVAPNVVVISPTLVTAGQPTRESLRGLKAGGYAAVIYLAPGDSRDAIPDEARILESQGIEFVHVPIPWQAPEAQHLAATAAALDRLKGQKVLVHCQLNMRVSAVTFLYRTIHAKEDPSTAWADVKKVWTPTDQWATFIDQQLRANGIVFSRP